MTVLAKGEDVAPILAQGHPEPSEGEFQIGSSMESEKKTWLDFVIIGAQKSGTTTLFKHLVEHPAICMPPAKEIPFFSREEYFEKGWSWFLQGAFGTAPKEKLWGTASPQYMCFPQVPERMARILPQVKCIAILRDPVACAYSHYRMSARRQYESRSFDECVKSQLMPSALEESRLRPTRVNSYITWGEYGRILTAYTQHFPREQMLILFTNELALSPEALLARIYEFLSVDMYLPPRLDEKFHQGGTQVKLPLAATLLGVMPVQTIRKRVPLRLWRVLERWYLSFEQWNTISDQTGGIPLGAETLRALQEHFEADAVLLDKIVDSPPPWLPYQDARTAELSIAERPGTASEGRM